MADLDLSLPLGKHIETQLDVFELLMEIRNAPKGSVDPEELRKLIAVYGEDWKVQDMPHLWSLREFAVTVYLDLIATDTLDFPTNLQPPPGVRWNKGVMNRAIDSLQALNLVCRKWRTVTPSVFDYVRRLEPYIAAAKNECFPDPSDAEPLQNACGQLFVLFKAEYILNELLGGPTNSFEARKSSQELRQWLDNRANLVRKSMADNPVVRRMYLQPAMIPNEDAANARTEHGVFAEGLRDIFESQRPAVAIDAIWAKAYQYDNKGSCGILDLNSVNSIIRKSITADWCLTVFHMDMYVSTSTLLELPRVAEPWIMLLMGKYYIHDPVHNNTFCTPSSADAIACWFAVFWETTPKKMLFDGSTNHDLSGLNPRLPFSYRKWADGALLEHEEDPDNVD